MSLVNTPSFHKGLSGLERLIKLPGTPQKLDALANFTAESLRTANSRSTAPPQFKASRLPFWDDELQSLRKAKIRARRRRDHQEYRKLARSFKHCLRAKKKTWQARLCADINPSTAWEVTKKLTGLHKKAAPKPKPIARDMSAEQTAEQITSKFAAISNDLTLVSNDDPTFTTVFDGEPTEEEVEGILTDVPDEVIRRSIFKPAVGSSPGPDDIPAGILRLAWANPFGHLLLITLIHGYLVLGTCPTFWKYAIIHPIPKGGGDFRLIALLSQIGKICERIITWFLHQEIELSPETVRLSVTSRRPRRRPNRSPGHIQGLRSSQRRHPLQRPCRPIQPPSIPR